ncbi:fungal-specific transcription factor domain-containing protein [Exophiala viscosa]|uniref:Fungal-specific transcription factor domain-containing protein n=1 Tax=Exophiala viscosa TaxID=2486360 RepID=A0AAN6DY88_9EURO|nr:fungal-specific transcription factor domain-containing protein [Exophiala viscosa]
MDVSTPQNVFDDRENNATESTEKTKSQRRRLSSVTKSQARTSKTLACLSCRPRKIKCERVDGVCERCRSLEIPCTLPDRDERRIRYSKDYIVQLESQIADLRSVVADLQRQGQPQPSPHIQPSAQHIPTPTLSQPQKQRRMSSMSQSSLGPMASLQQAGPQQSQDSDTSTSPSMATEISGVAIAKVGTSSAESEAGESLITRLCGAQGRLNSKNDGQLRYFGPTSSLHLTESVTSIFRYCNDVAKFGAELEKDIPWAMQQYLLDLYWKYQHNVLLIIHKEAFLAGMESGRSPYYNNCLLLCILVSAARISDSPEIRALAIAEEGNTNETPILRKRAEEALEKDLLNPSLTTIQSLILLSVLDCCVSNDSRGWMRSGNACRLAFDLGLHQEWSHLPNSQLSPIDLEVRRVIFWACFGFDRLWGVYLGRPPVIKLTDVFLKRPDPAVSSWDLKVLAAWVELLDLAGQVSEKLNTNTCFQDQIDCYMVALRKWESNLDPTISWFPNAPPGLYQLRIQHSALVILLNRHNAGFGNADKRNCPESNTSRRNCIECALLIANLVQDYSLHHGNPNTLMGSSLYNITMAATIFVADIAEKNRQNVSKELTALTVCLEAMKKMESAEIVARNVRKIVQTIMRVCGVQNQGDLTTNASTARSWQTGVVVDLPTAEDPMTSTERDMMDFNFDPSMLDALQFPFEEVLLDPLSANDFLQL